ncbi:MAG: carbohydrate ABC transporter permease [Rhodospirillales bacterium]|nr:carbohydrate ABC transporter permease [Rhodospirillales bacterium]
MKTTYISRQWPIITWYVLIAIGLVITLVPFVWPAVSSLKPNTTIFADLAPFSLSAFLPGTDVSAYTIIFAEKGFGEAILNTLFVSFVTVFLGVFINSLAGFAFAIFDFPGKPFVFLVVLISFSIPFEAIAIPLFILMRQIGWYDTYLALILPGVANGIVVFLYRQFFANIPKALIEAARADGASWWRIYRSICMPLTAPVSVGAGLLLFIFQWESFLWPLIVAPSPRLRLIQVAVARMQTEYGIFWNEQFAASTIAGLIPLIFILIFQRQFVSALIGVDLK